MSDISQTSRFNQTVETEWYSCIALHLAPACHERAADCDFLCRSEQRYCWPMGPTRSLESHYDKSLSHWISTWYHRVTSVARTSIYLPCRNNNVLRMAFGHLFVHFVNCVSSRRHRRHRRHLKLRIRAPLSRPVAVSAALAEKLKATFLHVSFIARLTLQNLHEKQKLKKSNVSNLHFSSISMSETFRWWCSKYLQVMDFKVRSADDQNLQGMKASKSVEKASVWFLENRWKIFENLCKMPWIHSIA